MFPLLQMDLEHTNYTSNSKESTSICCNCKLNGAKSSFNTEPDADGRTTANTDITLTNSVRNNDLTSGIEGKVKIFENTSNYKAGVVHSQLRSTNGTSTKEFSRSASSFCPPQTNRSPSLPGAASLDEPISVPYTRRSLHLHRHIFPAELQKAARFRPLFDAATELQLVQPMDELLPFAGKKRLYGN